MTHAQALRMMWIDHRLTFWSDDPLRRADIAAAWGISIPQASNDLAMFAENWPTRMAYDHRRKGYFARTGSKPVFSRNERGAAALAANVAGAFVRSEARP